MKSFVKLLLIFITFSMLTSCQEQSKNASVRAVDYVDPMIGTDFFGHTFPGATLPFAMVQLSPDNDTHGWTYSSGYAYQDNTIMGFSHTHLSGTGYTACGDVLLMPTVSSNILVTPGAKDHPEQGYRSRFSHEEESASPGYYEVFLQDYGIKAELTTTKRVGMHRYTFPKAAKAPVIMDLGHSIGDTNPEDISKITIVNDTLVTGIKSAKGTTVYFAAKFNKPFRYYGTFDAGYATPESGASLFPYKNEEIGEHIGGFFIYNTHQGEQLLVKVALSYVSIEGAMKNMQQELNHWSFDRERQEAKEAWNKALSAIEVESGSEDQLQIFYTAMYHSLLAQQISQDVDGQYFGMDGKVHVMEKGDFFPSFSCWDTYRTEHPLMTIIAPEHVNDMVRSIAAKTKAYGWLPAQHFRNRFGQGMVGDHLVPIIVDAYQKGFRDYDVASLYAAMKRKAMSAPPSPLPGTAGRSGLASYIKLGYAPCDEVTESVPNTLELAYNDWCIAQMAQAMGKEDDYDRFMLRAANYKNVFDKKSGFFRPRLADGSWLPALDGHTQSVAHNGAHSYYKYFDPLLVGRRPNRHYTESNAWQYLWSVQHDPTRLVQLLGGGEAFSEKLDSFFEMSPTITPPKYVGVVGTIGQYVQGNQPSHHVAYLYNYTQKPWKTQMHVREVATRLYRTGPGGICGNEDMGSLSSWYVFSALGFYPVTPGQTQYAIGSPIINKAIIRLKEGKTFTILVENNSLQNKFISSATLNGKAFNRSWIDHKEIMRGGVLKLVMSATPNRQWAVEKQATPYSMSK